MSIHIAVIGGDGIGPEVVEQAIGVMNAAGPAHKLQTSLKYLDYSGRRYLKTGAVITDEEMADLKSNYDAIFLGAVGTPEVKPGIIERGLLLRMRFELDQYINLRPVRLLPGVATPLAGRGPKDIDFDVVRENTEDLYCGSGGFLRKGTAQEVSTQEMMSTRFGVERTLRFAFDLSRRKHKAGAGRGRLTLVHKTNVLTFAGDTWFRAFNEIGDADYPDIAREYHHVDACCMYMVASPQNYDTLVTSNMFGDIITDLGAAIAGGMGVAASGNLNPDGTAPSMFEPVHGSAPDIAGQNKANPIAAVLSIAQLLKETGAIKQDAAATRTGEQIEAAVTQVCPAFQGKPLDRTGISCSDIGQMIIDAL
jgi:3-isopropylmalate dehydrogenase